MDIDNDLLEFIHINNPGCAFGKPTLPYSKIHIDCKTIIIPSAKHESDFKTINYGRPSTQYNYKSPEFRYAELPEPIRQILTDFPNIVLAGGSLINNLYGVSMQNEQDYDLFITGGENWEIIRQIIARFPNTSVEIGSGIVNINFETPWKGAGPIQLIMANYNSPEDVLNSFDLEQCKVAFCGGIFYMSELADFAIRHMVVPIDHVYRMTTTRICKYIARGFGLATSYDFPINRINDLYITYENDRVKSAIMKAYEIDGEQQTEPYAASGNSVYLTSDPVLTPFIIFTSMSPYNAEINYENITWREYLNLYCFDYEHYELDEVYEKWHAHSLTRNDLKITYRYVCKIFELFHEKLDQKINFWIDSFHNSDVPVTIE